MTQATVKTPPQPITFISAEGFSLRADAWGDPSHPPALFMHGGGQTRHSWGGAAAALATQGWYAVSLDLRGHGDSGWSPSGSYVIDDFVGDLRRVVEDFTQPPVLVGASLGGVTALVGAGEAGEGFCSAVVLVDIAPKVEPEGVARIRAFMAANPDGFASLAEAADAVAAYRRHRERPKDVSGLKKNLRLKENGRYYWHWDPAFMKRDLTGLRDREERLRGAARGLDMPSLLVRGGSSDVVSGQGVKEFLQLAPRAEFADVSGAGHMVAGDKNDAFNGAVEAFLQRSVIQKPGIAAD